jgi:hypothetical protein
MPPKVARCPYCSKALPSQNAVRLHVSATRSCHETWKKQFSQKNGKPSHPLPLKKTDENPPLSPCTLHDSPTDDEMDTIAENIVLPISFVTPSESIGEDLTRPASIDNNPEVEERALRFSQQYPRLIANPIRLQRTRFEKQRDEDITNGKHPWEPFSSQDEWELGRWLINNVNQKGTDKYLNLPIVSQMRLQRINIRVLRYV